VSIVSDPKQAETVAAMAAQGSCRSLSKALQDLLPDYVKHETPNRTLLNAFYWACSHEELLAASKVASPSVQKYLSGLVYGKASLFGTSVAMDTCS